MGTGMKRIVFCPALVFLLILCGSVAYAADGVDITLTVSGIEGVEAISSAVSGDAMVNQTLIGNRLEERDVVSTSIMQDTFRDGRGILSVNQASGNINNQANVRVLAIADGEGLVYDLSLATSARSIKNTVVVYGGEREDRISNSFGGAIGIVGVNQSAGNLNQQVNVLVLGIGVALGPEAITLGDATLGDISADNSLKSDGAGGSRADVITDALAGFRGIAQMSQSSGDLNAMGNRIGLSFTVVNGP
jgi:hypothetical protein